MRAALGLMLVVAACGSGKPASITNTAPVRGAPTPCPADAALDRVAKSAFGEPVTDVWCVAIVRTGTAFWWLAGYGPHSEEALGSPSWRGLVAPDGKVAWRKREDPSPYGFEYSGQHAIDLDGDGTDEVMYSVRFGEGGFAATHVVAIGFARDEPVIGELELGWSGDAGAKECAGDWNIHAGPNKTQRITIEQSGECPASRKVYRWTGTAFAEVTP